MRVNDPVVIVSAARTPLGGMLSDFKDLSASQLGSIAIRAAVERSGVNVETVDEVTMGCVLSAGLGQAPARQAALSAGLPLSTRCSVVSKVCGSGMKATMVGHDMLLAGSAKAVVAGGMESMTNAPYLLPKARGGYRMGHDRIIDHMFLDGLEDAYFDKGRLMGTFAEDCAQTYHFSREQQDDWAITSLDRARVAAQSGAFEAEIVPITVKSGRSERLISIDELPLKADINKIRQLKPAFRDGGTVTAANSSSIADGAAAMMLMRQSQANAWGLEPQAVIMGHASFAGRPALFPTAPVGAIRALLEQLGWETTDVDLWEINEAFAVVTMAAIRDLGLAPDTVNIHGGACALGHPIGASGARILVTLLSALKQKGLRRGVASVCIGGGEATALAVELCY
jgi:acetyl-CoA C-acetyltransferase